MRRLVLVLFLLTGCGPSVPPLTPLSSDAVILAFGDSLTYGTGAGIGESYPDVLQAMIGRTVIRSGVPGEITADSLQRLPGVLDETTPKLMILCIGGNDFMRVMSLRNAEDNIRAMVRLAREKGVEVVLVGVPKFGLSISPPEFYPKIAEEFHIPYEGEIMHKVLVSSDLKADEVHPNAKGYRFFAESLATLLKKAKAI